MLKELAEDVFGAGEDVVDEVKKIGTDIRVGTEDELKLVDKMLSKGMNYVLDEVEEAVKDWLLQWIAHMARMLNYEWVLTPGGCPPHCVFPPLPSNLRTVEKLLIHIKDIVVSDIPGVILAAGTSAGMSKIANASDKEDVEKVHAHLASEKTFDFWSTESDPWGYYRAKLALIAELPRISEAFDKALDVERSPMVKPLEYRWMDDEEWAFQRMNGLDPTVIKQVTSWPYTLADDPFAPATADLGGQEPASISKLSQELTDDLLRSHFGPAFPSVECLVKAGRLFVTDYSMLQIVVDTTAIDRNAVAPIVFFYRNEEGTLRPLCIQLKQVYTASVPDPTEAPVRTLNAMVTAESNPLFFPNDGIAWLAAKMHCNSAQVNNHEIWSHLGRTHLTMETVWLAANRCMPASHPVVELLRPTLFFTCTINALARVTLVKPNSGVIQTLFMPNQAALTQFLKQQWEHLSFEHYDVPHNIKSRGVGTDNLPQNCASEDSLELWSIINDFVASIMDNYYADDAAVAKDPLLKKWCLLLTKPQAEPTVRAKKSAAKSESENVFLELLGELADGLEFAWCNTSKGGAGFKGFPWQLDGDESVQTKKQLYKFLAEIIFNCSAGHGMVNNGQFNYMGFMPNAPITFRQSVATTVTAKKCPGSLGATIGAQQLALARACPQGDTGSTRSILIAYGLSAPTDDLLGSYDSEHFFNGAMKAQVATYQRALKAQSERIAARNNSHPDVLRRYWLCKPGQLAQGISI